MTINGNVNLNQITEKQFSQILQFKLSHEGQFQFNPTAAQLDNTGKFNSVNITWNSIPTMKVVIELLSILESE